jgi:K+-transporting ATPase A subunit
LNKLFLVVYIFWALLTNAQNQLPIANAALETIAPQTNSFSSWSNFQTNGGQANYSIETRLGCESSDSVIPKQFFHFLNFN